MKPHELWAELKRRRVVRVVIAYAAVVFGVLQVADLTFEPLGLPDWTYRFLVVLCLVGFPVVVALAWAFDVTPEGVRPDPGAGGEEASGEERASAADHGAPTAPDRGVGHVGRWVVAAAVGISLVVGFWQFTGDPRPADAEGVDPELIAVVPFRISSADEEVTILREGIVDMLAPIFSGVPRTVDSGAMISAWRNYAEDESAELSEGQAVELARRLGAGRVLVGSVVGSGEGFALQARLLRVPGGELVGDAAVDGSAAELREVVRELAAQLFSMEAGVEQAQLEYLAEVPLPALQAYLEGRRAYRRSAYEEARAAYIRALNADSTFALAALGAVEAVDMGADADRFNVRARAIRLLDRYVDDLPPREREYAQLGFLDAIGASSAVELVQGASTLVGRLPDKAEAWYLYGDRLIHAAWRVGESDWLERAEDAFARARALDPGLQVVAEHQFYLLVLDPRTDAADLREATQEWSSVARGSESEAFARAMAGFALNDSIQLAWLRSSLDTLSYASAVRVSLSGGMPNSRAPVDILDAAFDRLERVAVADADRRQALEERYEYLRSAGRSAEADEQLYLIEAAYGPRERAWIEAWLYWDGQEESAASAARRLGEKLEGSDPLPWTEGGRDACALELWRLRNGDASGVPATVARLRAGSDDPDPAHGGNALCILTLQTVAAHLTGDPRTGELVDRMVRVVDQGPPGALSWPTLELAWILESRGDLAAAARVAGYASGNDPYFFAGSTVMLESGRLQEAAGNPEEALARYRWFLTIRGDPDPRLKPVTDSVEARVRALQAELGEGR